MNDRFWQSKDVIPPAEAGRLLRAKRIVDQQYRALYGEEILAWACTEKCSSATAATMPRGMLEASAWPGRCAEFC